MMDQLGIRSLRPGPGGDEKALNHANYYESLANSYPQLPDALTTNDVLKVMSAKMWWDVRRPEIVEWMERDVYGRIPANVPQATWAVVASEREMVYGMPVNAKQLVGHVDKSAYPLIDVNIALHGYGRGRSGL